MSIQIQVPIAELQKYKIMLATPMYGGQCLGMYSRSIADLTSICTHYKIGLQMYYLFNESLITRARNYCSDEFMRSDCTHLMFIDADIGFNANDIIALLAIQISDPNKYDVITAAYPKKCISWEKIKMAVDKGFADQDPNTLEKFVGDYVFNPRANTTQIPLNEPVEVLESGTGFMMISKQTFEKYKEFYKEYHYKPDHVRTEHFDGSREIMAYFDCIIDRGYDICDVKRLLQKLVDAGKDHDDDLLDDLRLVQEEAEALLDREKKASKRYLSEDYMFCQNVIKMGGRIWLCPWMKLNHTGSYVFSGSLADLAAVGAPATADAVALDKARKASKIDPLQITK